MGRTVNQLILRGFQEHDRSPLCLLRRIPARPFWHGTPSITSAPKSTFPREVYRWVNLFLACDVCQKAKGEDFHETALKPDATDYGFDRYFLFNVRTGEDRAQPRRHDAGGTRARSADHPLAWSECARAARIPTLGVRERLCERSDKGPRPPALPLPLRIDPTKRR